MKFNDAVTGTVISLLALAVIAYSKTFPIVPGRNFGSSLFPQLIGVAMLICGVLLIMAGIRDKHRIPLINLDSWVRSRRHLINFTLVPASLLFYILTSDLLGFLVTSVIILITLLISLEVKVRLALSLAIPVTLAIQFFFGNLLRVPLPVGILGW